MSRTNPFLKKRRAAKTTVLLCGEGKTESTFLKYLKSLYAFETGKNFKIKTGKGGSSHDVVMGAKRSLGDFDKKVVLLDADKPEKEMRKARNLAKKSDIELIENTPCIEALFLSVLQKETNFQHKNSSWCKKEFGKKYIQNRKHPDLSDYKKLFPYKLLEKRKSDIAKLNDLIRIFCDK